jgi:hypothetical protein
MVDVLKNFQLDGITGHERKVYVSTAKNKTYRRTPSSRSETGNYGRDMQVVLSHLLDSKNLR